MESDGTTVKVIYSKPSDQRNRRELRVLVYWKTMERSEEKEKVKR